jgi:hypothetical protein
MADMIDTTPTMGDWAMTPGCIVLFSEGVIVANNANEDNSFDIYGGLGDEEDFEGTFTRRDGNGFILTKPSTREVVFYEECVAQTKKITIPEGAGVIIDVAICPKSFRVWALCSNEVVLCSREGAVLRRSGRAHTDSVGYDTIPLSIAVNYSGEPHVLVAKKLAGASLVGHREDMGNVVVFNEDLEFVCKFVTNFECSKLAIDKDDRVYVCRLNVIDIYVKCAVFCHRALKIKAPDVCHDPYHRIKSIYTMAENMSEVIHACVDDDGVLYVSYGSADRYTYIAEFDSDGCRQSNYNVRDMSEYQCQVPTRVNGVIRTPRGLLVSCEATIAAHGENPNNSMVVCLEFI